MPFIASLISLTLAVICVRAAQQMAVRQGRSPRAWMMATALLGPFPLLPLALSRKKNG